jgi:imidazolonepropionase-like amidohydrolase
MLRCVAPVLFLLPVPLFAQPEQKRQQQPLVFTQVTVIDATGAPAQQDMTVVITGNRITALGKTGKVKVPEGCQEIDAAGRFLIPGLWDMHVRLWEKSDLELCTANGITGVRQMSAGVSPKHPNLLEWRKEMAVGQLSGPRLILAGPVLDGSSCIWRHNLSIMTPAEGRQAVANIKKDGYDFVNVNSGLSREVYFAIVDEAKKQGLPLVGHVPDSVRALEASNAGQKSIEHLDEIALGCSSQEQELGKEMQEAWKDPRTLDNERLRRLREQIHASYDKQKAAALFERFVANQTWQCPTLTVHRAMAFFDDPEFARDPRLKFLSPRRREWWDPKKNPHLKKLTTADFTYRKQLFRRQLELAGTMRQAGVPFLAGTDTGNPYCFAGFSLHDELALLVKAGFTPMEALQTATRNPAKYLDRLKEFGTVEQGKIADLVLLEADPLKDIKNTQQIAAVVVSGKLLPKEALQKMLAEVEALATKK